MKNIAKFLVLVAGLSACPEIFADATWVKNLSEVEIPNQEVQGRLHGRTFVLESAELSGNILELRQGKDFFPDLAVQIFLFKEDSLLPGSVFDLSTNEFGNPHVWVKWREQGKGIPSSETFMKGYAMRLKFGERSGDTIPVSIYLCLPDAQQSVVAGQCVAKIWKETAGKETAGSTIIRLEDGPPTHSRSAPLLPIFVGVLGVLCVIAGSIWIIVVAFRKSLAWGLVVFFVPFAQIVFICMHWRQTWKPCLLSLLALILFVIGGVSLAHSVKTGMDIALQEMSPVPNTPLSATDVVRPAPDKVLPVPDRISPAAKKSAAKPSDTVKGVRLGSLLEEVVCERGDPKARFQQGTLVILEYPDVTIKSHDGKTVTSVEKGWIK